MCASIATGGRRRATGVHCPEGSRHDTDAQTGTPLSPGPLAYLGLAILGWGGFAAFFSHPALIALTIVVVLMTGVSLFPAAI